MSSDAVKRVMAEVRELAALQSHPGSLVYAAPLESDLFEWHFSVRGPPETPFASGVYHGRILLPPEYPLKAPEIILLTPNGRFEVGTRICLSVTSHHNETWQPSWGIRTILTALVGFMPSKAEGIGALDYSDAERRALARKSHSFNCSRCGAVPTEQLPNSSQVTAPSAGMSRIPATESLPKSSSSSVESIPADVVATVAEDAREDAETQVTPNAGEPSGAASHEAEPLLTPVALTATQAPGHTDTASSVPSPGHSVVASAGGQPRADMSAARRRSQEKELLYLAYAIAAAIVAIVGRRVFLSLV
jgi:ubiquitin-conjugating enzyme E2 J1